MGKCSLQSSGNKINAEENTSVVNNTVACPLVYDKSPNTQTTPWVTKESQKRHGTVLHGYQPAFMEQLPPPQGT